MKTSYNSDNNLEKINISEIEKFTENIKSKENGKIISHIPTINNVEIEFYFDFDKIHFKTNEINFVENIVEYQSTNYGILEPFKIITNKNMYLVKNGAKTSSFHFKSTTISGTINNLEVDSFNKAYSFFKAVIPLNKFANAPVKYFLGRGFTDNNFKRIAGYINLIINKSEVGFYDFNINNKNYLIIETKKKTDIKTFEKLFEVIINSFALISGNLIRNYVFIFNSTKNHFNTINDFKFKKLEDDIISPLEIFNSREYKTYNKHKKMVFFPIDIFSKLCESTFNSVTLFRAIKILNQARNLPIEIRIASFFVSLETVKKIIIDEKISEISPIKNKKYSNKLVKNLRKIIIDLPDDEFNDKKIIIKKIENINKPTNSDEFIKAFEILGIKLNPKDIECINKRNSFLHGNIPVNEMTDELILEKLQEICINSHTLTCSLILKYIGYNGPIKDYLKYIDIIQDKNLLDTPLFRHI